MNERIITDSNGRKHITTEPLLHPPQRETVSMHEFLCMKQTAESYMELMDAHCKELDRAMELLRRAEVEMRYAGWLWLDKDNTARNGVYEQIKEFLK